MNLLQGLTGALGCAKGTAVVIDNKTAVVEKKTISNGDDEVSRLKEAKERYFLQLAELEDHAKREVGEKGAGIFAAYREILSDDVFFDKIIDKIKAEKVNAEYAIDVERAEVVALFEQLDDEYLRERATDITNVCMELIGEMQGVKKGIAFDSSMGHELIAVAEDLTPADTIKMDKTVLKGIVTETGGVTSHTVILAKTLGIPAVVGLKGAMSEIRTGDEILVFGNEGKVVINPDDKQLTEFESCRELEKKKKKLFETKKGLPAVTLDGKMIKVNVNSGDSDSIASFRCDECDGIGLFRTEFIYMDHKQYPTEDEQFEVYRSMALKNQGKELIIRTLDIGGDKQLEYMDLPKESNPFLGYRAIRICLDRVEVFKTQLRAILRAGVFGDVKIMFPMIVNLEELLRAKEILEETKKDLQAEGIDFKKDIPVGIMIETPAAVMLSDKLAEEVSFFSIGSNDLIQYTTAADRMNERVQSLYDSFNISVLRSIQLVCDNAKKNGVMVGICGEAASESKLVPLWVAMGVDELSMVPSQVGKVKYMIGNLSAAEMKKTLDDVLNLGRIEEVKSRLADVEKKILG
ncbi:phosphoenolpyruvate--protein phosphotransferase [Sinanaerobacter chloroacetimidivorans]|uniref:Phosphoenolpyruvate-protein phosphotransferase n=1 Tax=Sinanaerobacter chloroacetimidivorans TaxID=2818044 RepID=A0A8J7W314_9FIRM|nr:phosphoenolpyruvate--protein phosphotransferase [Sinanaerobacter chloroacetimidivorans]MBR0598248.1 phosphoenolpyruvate--protein phosphotransferase [Sinanaerobacter chloroacetimidivorans]